MRCLRGNRRCSKATLGILRLNCMQKWLEDKVQDWLGYYFAGPKVLKSFCFGVTLLFLSLICAACQRSGTKVEPDLTKFSGLAENGVRIGIVDPDLGPAGRYAFAVLEKLKSFDTVLATAMIDNVITHESHVRALLDKIMRREIDAGFIYRSDALMVADRLNVVEIPTSFSVSPEYSLARIKGSLYPEVALNFINWLIALAQRDTWVEFGFKVPPIQVKSTDVGSVNTLIVPDSSAKLTIFAAAVFYDVLKELSCKYTDLNGVEIVCEFAGSGKLYQKIEHGAQGRYGADIFLSAAPCYVAELECLGLADCRQTFMRNDLVVGVSKP